MEETGCEAALNDRMVEKQDFVVELEKKASKIDYENCLKYFKLLHN
jgi:hypothetical protein